MAQVQAGLLSCSEVHGAVQTPALHLWSSIQGEGAGRSFLARHLQLQRSAWHPPVQANAARVHVQNVRAGAADGNLVMVSDQIHQMFAVNVFEPDQSKARDV